jgi:hypothetical protein
VDGYSPATAFLRNFAGEREKTLRTQPARNLVEDLEG